MSNICPVICKCTLEECTAVRSILFTSDLTFLKCVIALNALYFVSPIKTGFAILGINHDNDSYCMEYNHDRLAVR